jgi:hypothetical protein
MLPPLLGQSHRIGKYLHGISLGQVHNSIDLAARSEFVDKDVGLVLELFLQAAQQARRHDAVENAARSVVQRRVGLEQNAWGPPWCFFQEIGDAHAC